MKQLHDLELIFFHNPNSFYSKLIQDFTNSKWNHIGIITHRDNETGTIEVYEALNQGLVKKSYNVVDIFERQLHGQIEIKTLKVELTPIQIKEVCKKYLGRGYSWFAIVMIVVFRPFLTIDYFLDRYFGFDKYILTRPFYWLDSCRQLICSEFVARVVYDVTKRRVNFAQEYNKPYIFVTPKDIYYSNVWMLQSFNQRKEDLQDLYDIDLESSWGEITNDYRNNNR